MSSYYFHLTPSDCVKKRRHLFNDTFIALVWLVSSSSIDASAATFHSSFNGSQTVDNYPKMGMHLCQNKTFNV